MLFHTITLALIIRSVYSHNKNVDLNDPSNFLKQFKFQDDVNTTIHYKDLKAADMDAEFDFIIIGSGSAGSVLANRLSEIAEWKIALLEVGHKATGLTDIPMLAPAFQFTDLNWNYLMEKQEGIALGMVDQRMAWPRGRALGGTTIINYMLAVRGNKDDYNIWEKMGNPGWSYQDVFKYFLKSEDASIAINDTGFHSTGGYLSIQDVPYRTESVHAWIKACQEAGYKYIDYNGNAQIGVSYVQGTTKKGARCSVEKAFLRPAKNRKNLKILTGARVTEILINHETKEAYGVKYLKDGKYYTIAARKEVISSAGTFHSPQLLMLSGIGPKNQLDEIGVKQIQELPVGQKMYDHLTFLGLLYSVNESITTKTTDLISPISLIEWKLGRGPFTGLGGVESFTYMKTRNEGPATLPDMELLFIGLGLHTDAGLLIRKSFRVSDKSFKYWSPLIGKPGFQVFPMLLHPKSFGYLKLKSNNPLDDPIFYGNFFTDPEGADIKSFITAIREIQRIVGNSQAFKKYNAKLVPWSIPGCEKEEPDSDAYWTCGLRHLSTTLHHQVTTCKMGPKSDPEAVVDHELKVHGIKRLRVSDSSVFPKPIAAHMNVPSVMVGEKTADLIKLEWGHLVQ